MTSFQTAAFLGKLETPTELLFGIRQLRLVGAVRKVEFKLIDETPPTDADVGSPTKMLDVTMLSGATQQKDSIFSAK